MRFRLPCRLPGAIKLLRQDILFHARGIRILGLIPTINDFSGDSKYVVPGKSSVKGMSGSLEASIHADGNRGGDSMLLHGYADKVVGGLH